MEWLDEETCLTRDECIAELLANLPEDCTYCRLGALEFDDE